MNAYPKISQTILEFGQPILCQLPENPTKIEFEAAIKIVITAWNVVVLDQVENNDAHERMLLEALKAAPKDAEREIKSLVKRKKKKFASDLRGVGHHWVREENGSLTFGCDARDVASGAASLTRH